MSIQEYFTIDRLVSGILFFIIFFCQEAIKEIIHWLKVQLGFMSNITKALHRDKKIDAAIHDFVNKNECVASTILAKITNGGGVPKEGSPLNSCITNPVEKRSEWTLTEVSPFFRGIVQQVYKDRRMMLPIEGIPTGDPSYAYLKSQKEEIFTLEFVMVKETRKGRYILSIRLSCEPHEFMADNRLREDIRKMVSEIRKHIS